MRGEKRENMEPVEFRDIEYIMAVYEERSFSRAAQKRFISQPALSKIVRKVEKNLGVTIFDRGSFPLKVTPEGENVLEYFGRMQGIRAEMEQYCENIRIQRKCDLTIVAPSFFCTYVLPPIVSGFQAENPDYDIKLMETNDNDMREFLRTGIADIGISANGNMPAEMEMLELKREMIVLAVPAAYPVNRGLESMALSFEDLVSGRLKDPDVPGVSMETFSGERFLFLKQGNDMRRRGMKICRDAGFSPKIVMELDQLLTAYYLSAAGEGATFTRSYIPYYTGRTDKLCFYKIDHPGTVRTIHILRSRSMELSEKQKKFVEYLRQYPLPG